jgi:hypothetical protein
MRNEPKNTLNMRSKMRMPEYRKFKCCTALQMLAVNFENRNKKGSP